MIVGFVAALLSFGILKVMGEPAVDRAIAFESATDEAKAKTTHDAVVAKDETPPPPEEEYEIVSRPTQAGIGLFTGVTAYSIAFGGLFSLAFAILYGRMGDFSPRLTAALIALSGFLAVYAVPILKYPANPPSIGNPDTIGLRTGIYFGMILLSLGSMIAAWSVRNRLMDQLGAWNATIVAEYVDGGNHIAFGLGSLISVATADGNYPLLAAGVVTMAVFVVLLNRFFWKRLYRLAEDRYSLNM